MTTMAAGSRSAQAIDAQIKEVLTRFPKIVFAMLLGSVALSRQRADSDLDIAVAAKQALTAHEKIALISALADCTGRPIDLIDLKLVSQPLLGQIVRHGTRIAGSDTLYGELISRHLFEQTDFMPYRTRLLAERRMAWIGKQSSKNWNRCVAVYGVQNQSAQRMPPRFMKVSTGKWCIALRNFTSLTFQSLPGWQR